jgi:hypothetical protein
LYREIGAETPRERGSELSAKFGEGSGMLPSFGGFLFFVQQPEPYMNDNHEGSCSGMAREIVSVENAVVGFPRLTRT